jgi:ubiquinone/menaquinone biosynthesis C-methylase UbiE
VSVLKAPGYFNGEKERRAWQNPENILLSIGLKPGSTFIDLGCGDGFFAVPAANIVGRNGRVYALDMNSEAIDRLKGESFSGRVRESSSEGRES